MRNSQMRALMCMLAGISVVWYGVNTYDQYAVWLGFLGMTCSYFMLTGEN